MGLKKSRGIQVSSLKDYLFSLTTAVGHPRPLVSWDQMLFGNWGQEDQRGGSKGSKVIKGDQRLIKGVMIKGVRVN